MRGPRGFTVIVRLSCAALLVGLAGWSGVLASASPTVRVDAGPAAGAFDSPVHLEVSGLRAGEQVTLAALVRDRSGRLWRSWARFSADPSGAVDLARAVPQAGTYRVADAAGLLWSLRPAYPAGPSAPFAMDVTAGFTVEVQVVADGRVQAETALTRDPPPARPRRLTVEQAGFDGSLFLPEHTAADSAAVVVIGGSDGGEALPDVQAAALAAAGHPALALAYFDEPGLPSCLCSIPLEYFARAVAWLRAQPEIAARPVVLVGASRGGEAALAVAAYEPSVFDAVVANSPSDRVRGAYGPGAAPGGAAWTLEGAPLDPGTVIPVRGIRVPLLLSAGGQDAVWDSAEAVDSVMYQLDAVPGALAHTDLYFPDAGHAVAGSPPDFPLDEDGLGGSPDADALAAERFWPRMLAFVDDAHRRQGGSG